MEEKFCTGCQKSKLVDEFWRKKNKPQSRCKDCQREYHKQHYKDNLKVYKNRAKKRNSRVLEEMREYIRTLKNVPCQDCEYSYPYYVMDFDHRPGEEKLFNVSQMAREKLNIDAIKKEISKCDIVCSNCHRIRTYNRSKS
jgi:hypothetical protein